jgi:hypothetical protein
VVEDDGKASNRTRGGDAVVGGVVREVEDVAAVRVDVPPALAEMLLASEENREARDEIDGPVVLAARGASASRRARHPTVAMQ